MVKKSSLRLNFALLPLYLINMKERCLMNTQTRWPTEKNDMRLANTIIEKYLDLSEGEPLGLVEIIVNDKDEQVDIRPAPWVEELTDMFKAKYGQEHGQDITSMVITRCLLKGETVH
jgi:hypothetical protein